MENNSANVFCVHIYILMSTSSVVFETKNNRGILKHQTSIVQLKLQLSVIKFWRKSHQTSCIDFVIYTILLFSLLRAFFLNHWYLFKLQFQIIPIKPGFDRQQIVKLMALKNCYFNLLIDRMQAINLSTCNWSGIPNSLLKA